MPNLYIELCQIDILFFDICLGFDLLSDLRLALEMHLLRCLEILFRDPERCFLKLEHRHRNGEARRSETIGDACLRDRLQRYLFGADDTL